jgi:uncharacterized protein (TIGR03085 family)
MSASALERAALVKTFRAVGPDEPTLCGAWTTRDLAAHLVVRERRLDAAPGIAFGPLAGYTERVQRGVAESTDWGDLVDLVASGPPLYSPFKLLDPLVNTGEMFIHHEDVRRARVGWKPRELDPRTAAALRRMLRLMSRMTLAGAPARVTMREPSGPTVAPIGRGPQLEIIGDAGELVLFLSGRDEVRLEFDGDADTVDAVRAARRAL